MQTCAHALTWPPQPWAAAFAAAPLLHLSRWQLCPAQHATTLGTELPGLILTFGPPLAQCGPCLAPKVDLRARSPQGRRSCLDALYLTDWEAVTMLESR